jgi:SsrA-binding protein
MTIEKYSFSNTDDNNLRKQRKLLLNKNELKKLLKETINSSNTIIPLKLFINERGLAKIEISLAKGKKLYDKRETIKDRDNKKDLDRLKKIKNQK